MRILAISPAHDSSVCVFNNGELEFFCKEERLSRKKRDKHPMLSLELYKSLNLGKIDHALWVAPGNDEPLAFDFHYSYCKKLLGVELENFSSLQHHLCHASLAFYNSGFKEALVFVIDRNGSMFFINNAPVARESESVFVGYADGVMPVHKSFWLYDGYENKKHEIRNVIHNHYEKRCSVSAVNSMSIVKVYEAATTLIGQDNLENGKTMGLAAYGADQNYEPLFINGMPINEYFIHINRVTCFHGYDDKITLNVTPQNMAMYANKAKHVQLETQRVALELISEWVNKTHIKNVCVVGGYGLNVVANQHYLKHLPNVNFYFEPVADDTGTPIGACMIKHKWLTGKTPTGLKHNFYHYYDAESDKYLPSSNTKVTTVEEVCDLLIQQKTVAIFDGAPEAGPRALGHRSILFDPRNPKAKELVNKVKRREWYRPFAGVVLKSEFSKYFETLGLEEAPFMTINFECKDITKRTAPGIVHADGSCRVQTVADGFLYELLTLFYEKTGCPLLLNTSFNLAGEALVQTKKDALNTFSNSKLDAVYFVNEKFLITKET